MRGAVLKNNFTSGEVTPLLDGRIELDVYQKAVETCLNMIPLRHGGAARRPGTKYLGEVKDSSKAVRLIPFVFSNDDSYVIEMGDQYMRFWTTGGQIYSTTDVITNGTFDSNITGWADASIGTATIAWSASEQALELVNGGLHDTVRARQTVSTTPGVEYRLQASRKTVTGPGNTVVLCEIGLSGFGTTDYAFFLSEPETDSVTFTATGSFVYITFYATINVAGSENAIIDDVSMLPTSTALELSTPFLQSELSEVMYAQSNDVMWFTHQNHHPRKLTRTGSSSFSIAEASVVGGPYNQINTTTSQTFQMTVGSGWTVGNTVNLLSWASYFTANDVGDYFLIIDKDDVGWFTILRMDTYVGATNMTCTIIATFGLLGAAGSEYEQDDAVGTGWGAAGGQRGQVTSRWAHSLVSSRYGYPAAVTLHDQRIIYGGFPGVRSQEFAGSTSGDFEQFTYGVNDDDHFDYVLATTKQGAIRWMTSFNDLIIGTFSQEYLARGGGFDDPITPSNIAARAKSSNGSLKRMPEHAGDQVVFIHRTGKKLIALYYEEQAKNVIDSDLTLLAEHLTISSSIDQLSYAQEPDRVIWMVTDTGQLLGLTYDNKQNVAAWHVHDNAIYNSVASIPTTDRDAVFVLCQRDVNGGTYQYVERIEMRDWRRDDVPHLVDSGLTYSGTATDSFSGLDHLEGETVRAYGDGEDLGTYTVSSGAITVSKEVEELSVGLDYTSRIKELPDPVNAPDGTSVGRKRRKSPVRVRFYRTQAANINGDLAELPREASATKPELFTGTIDVTNLGWSLEGGNTIESIGANPLTVQYISSIITVGQE